MAWLTGLARVAQKTGYRVVEVEGWKTRGHGPMNTITTIVAHHTAGSIKGGNAASLGVVTNGRPGLKGPLSHYLLARDGTIYVVAAGLSWHTGAVRNQAWSNSKAIGIEAENNGLGEPWSERQIDSYAKLCAELVREFGLEVSDVRAHKEICAPVGRKPDPNFSGNPGFTMDAFRARVADALKGKVTPTAPTVPAPAPAKPVAPTKPVAPVPTPTPVPAPAKPVAKKAVVKMNAKDVEGVQTYLKAVSLYRGKIDGIYDQTLKDAVQAYQRKQLYAPGLAVDGIWGSKTQKHFSWVKGLQTALNKWHGDQIPVDGFLGAMTENRVRQVQRRNLYGAYQKAGGELVDGKPGPVTCKMLGISKHPLL